MAETLSGLLASLSAVMTDQRDRFKESFDVTKRQHDALMARDGAAISSLASEETRLGLTLRRLEEERKEVWRRVALLSRIPEGDLTWDSLSVHLDTAQAQAFSALLDEMSDLLKNLVAQNASNLHLLRSGVERGSFTIQAGSGGPAGTYGPDGQKPPSAGGGGLDRTA